MKIFLDTSSLVKLYHREADTTALELVFSTENITGIFLSEISRVEFASTIWKKVRTRALDEAEARLILGLFEIDSLKYQLVITDSLIIEQARQLITRYGMQGLRTLDSIQLATAGSLLSQADGFFTADRMLQKLFVAEGLPIGLTGS